MILKEIKQIKDLSEQDIIFSRIGNLSKLGTRINEKSLKYFPKAIRHTFLYLKRRRWIIWRPDKKINEEILNDDLNYLREKLIDNLKDVYKPFKEDDPIFITKGKNHSWK